MCNNKPCGEFAFCDGTPKDGQYFKDVVAHRRSQMSAEQALSLVLGYLRQSIDTLEKDMVRYREKKEVERYHSARERKEWAQGMVFWINHNV